MNGDKFRGTVRVWFQVYVDNLQSDSGIGHIGVKFPTPRSGPEEAEPDLQLAKLDLDLCDFVFHQQITCGLAKTHLDGVLGKPGDTTGLTSPCARVMLLQLSASECYTNDVCVRG